MRSWLILLALACDLAFFPRAGSLPDFSSAHAGTHVVRQKRARSPTREIAFCLGGSKTWSQAATSRFLQTLVPCKVGRPLLSSSPAAIVGIRPGRSVVFYFFTFFFAIPNLEILLRQRNHLSYMLRKISILSGASKLSIAILQRFPSLWPGKHDENVCGAAEPNCRRRPCSLSMMCTRGIRPEATGMQVAFQLLIAPFFAFWGKEFSTTEKKYKLICEPCFENAGIPGFGATISHTCGAACA
jgi:hypothetical protein